MMVAWWLQDGCMVVARWLHGGCRVVAWWFRVVAWWLYDGCIRGCMAKEIMVLSHGCYRMVAW